MEKAFSTPFGTVTSTELQTWLDDHAPPNEAYIRPSTWWMESDALPWSREHVRAFYYLAEQETPSMAIAWLIARRLFGPETADRVIPLPGQAAGRTSVTT